MEYNSVFFFLNILDLQRKADFSVVVCPKVGINTIYYVIKILFSARQLYFEGSRIEDGEFIGTVSWKSTNFFSGKRRSPDRPRPTLPWSEVLNCMIHSLTTAVILFFLKFFFSLNDTFYLGIHPCSSLCLSQKYYVKVYS